MLASCWQRLCIAQARSAFAKRLVQNHPRLSKTASRFVGGADAPSALQTALSLRERGIHASLFFLGEYVTDRETVSRTVEAKERIIEALGRHELDVHVSIDPTQIGYSIDDRLGAENALRIGRKLLEAPRTPRSYLMLDMEDSSITDRTIALWTMLRQHGVPTAITLQAYLKRTEADALALLRKGAPSIRLVKGAFAEPNGAWTRRREIDAAFLRMAALMLSREARDAGLFPVFATHDERIVDSVIAQARERGYRPGEYEFEMLYGVRPELQQRIAARGEQLRLYVPFGKDWWPYTVRRIGENPRNAAFLLRALLG